MTSIEWLDEQLQEHIISQDLVAQNLIIQISISEYFELKRQAKEMHYKEMESVYYEDRLIVDHEIGEEVGWEFKKYYNEKFKKD